jgi:hypothetical protein
MYSPAIGSVVKYSTKEEKLLSRLIQITLGKQLVLHTLTYSIKSISLYDGLH